MVKENKKDNVKKEWTPPELEIIDVESKTLTTTTGTGADGTHSYS